MPERSCLRALVIPLTLVVAVSFVGPVQAHAQRGDSTGGGWLEFALGYGSLHAFSGTLYGMPETESCVMTTACHFLTWPPLQIHTGL